MSDNENQFFTLGVTMAGAVSAGAYTAGVLDVLLAAMAAQEDEEDALPVILKAMSGTSAGGVCTAMTVPALLSPISPFSKNVPSLPIFHRLWVEEIDMLESVDPSSGTRRPGLTSQTDLNSESSDRTLPAFSALDSQAIESGAKRVVSSITASGQKLGWVSSDLELFITCTNLDGVPYRVPFNATQTDDGHRMANHAFVAHFRVTELGGKNGIESAWLKRWNDDGQKLTMSYQSGETVDFFGGNLKHLVDMGLVTGAFPFGLAARIVETTPGAVGVPDPSGSNGCAGGAFPIDIDPINQKVICEHGKLTFSDRVGFVGVDGGVCNNEPFELARFAIRGGVQSGTDWSLEANPREPDQADRAVIMIDPFPEGPEALAASVPTDADRAMSAILGGLKNALVNQARFKPSELIAAAEKDGRSRFLIAPSRKRGVERQRGANALASGFLGGFGGFFHRDFRQHDYDLGRHNAQSFLKKHFQLSSSNRLFEGTSVQTDSGTGKDVPILVSNKVLGEGVTVEEPEWPRLPVAKIQEVFEAVNTRLNAVKSRTIDVEVKGWVQRRFVSAAWDLIGRKRLNELFQRSALADLVGRDQIEETSDLSDDARKVLSELCKPGADLRTCDGLAKASELSVDQVGVAIKRLKNLRDPFELWKGPTIDDKPTYALKRYKPNYPVRDTFCEDPNHVDARRCLGELIEQFESPITRGRSAWQPIATTQSRTPGKTSSTGGGCSRRSARCSPVKA